MFLLLMFQALDLFDAPYVLSVVFTNAIQLTNVTVLGCSTGEYLSGLSFWSLFSSSPCALAYCLRREYRLRWQVSRSVILLTSNLPFSEHRRTITPKTLLALVFVFITLILLSSVPLPATLRSASFVTAGLARLIVIGTFLLGLLSGFGAMRSCWNFLIAPERPTATDRDLDVSTSALARVREDLAKRKDDLRRRQETTVPTQSAWYKRVVPSFGEDSERT